MYVCVTLMCLFYISVQIVPDVLEVVKSLSIKKIEITQLVITIIVIETNTSVFLVR